jgi:hypothetical protein
MEVNKTSLWHRKLCEGTILKSGVLTASVDLKKSLNCFTPVNFSHGMFSIAPEL